MSDGTVVPPLNTGERFTSSYMYKFIEDFSNSMVLTGVLTYTKASALYSSPSTNFIVAVTVISPADHVTLPSTAFSGRRSASNLICSPGYTILLSGVMLREYSSPPTMILIIPTAGVPFPSIPYPSLVHFA